MELTLKYKTRENVEPKNLPRVYFSCHPEDFEKWFQPITDDILRNINCVIYYLPEEKRGQLSEEELVELRQMMSSMQMLVAPVTKKYFDVPSVALTKELPMAQELHLPVVPIMCDRGLYDPFGIHFGKVQYIKHSSICSDPTEVPYEERLRTVLLKALVSSDEMLEKMRNAFVKSIFVSYRKKDREFAQRLIKMIHDRPGGEAIAVWYDEFLVAGEDYNDSIDEELRNCDLVALVVTPNLLEKSKDSQGNVVYNYVQRIEYPNAVQQGKAVMPSEMVKTDREELEKLYGDIAPCVFPEESLKELDDWLTELVSAERENDPVQDFILGLAYMNGIRVEKDAERACRLFERAAEAGNEEALRKLVSIYINGEGIPADIEKAIYYQEKLVALLNKNTDFCQKPDYYWEVFYLLKLYGGTQKYETARELLPKVLGKIKMDLAFVECVSDDSDKKLQDYYTNLFSILEDADELRDSIRTIEDYYVLDTHFQQTHVDYDGAEAVTYDQDGNQLYDISSFNQDLEEILSLLLPKVADHTVLSVFCADIIIQNNSDLQDEAYEILNEVAADEHKFSQLKPGLDLRVLHHMVSDVPLDDFEEGKSRYFSKAYDLLEKYSHQDFSDKGVNAAYFVATWKVLFMKAEVEDYIEMDEYQKVLPLIEKIEVDCKDALAVAQDESQAEECRMDLARFYIWAIQKLGVRFEVDEDYLEGDEYQAKAMEYLQQSEQFLREWEKRQGKLEIRFRLQDILKLKIENVSDQISCQELESLYQEYEELEDRCYTEDPFPSRKYAYYHEFPSPNTDWIYDEEDERGALVNSYSALIEKKATCANVEIAVEIGDIYGMCSAYEVACYKIKNEHPEWKDMLVPKLVQILAAIPAEYFDADSAEYDGRISEFLEYAARDAEIYNNLQEKVPGWMKKEQEWNDLFQEGRALEEWNGTDEDTEKLNAFMEHEKRKQAFNKKYGLGKEHRFKRS